MREVISHRGSHGELREDFVETQIEVDNYRQKVKDKYEALD